MAEEYEVFRAVCDQCGCEFPSSIEIWDGFDELSTRYHHLRIILSPHGYHDPWLCSRDCQVAMIQDLTDTIKEEYGETCCRCNRKIGSWSMKPCNVCRKIVCRECEIHANNNLFCSPECRSAVKNCTRCNKLIPAEGPDLCDYCIERA